MEDSDATEAAESSGEVVGLDEGRAPEVGSDGDWLQRHLTSQGVGARRRRRDSEPFVAVD